MNDARQDGGPAAAGHAAEATPATAAQPPLRRPFSAETMLRSVDWPHVLRGVRRRAPLVVLVAALFGALGLSIGFRKRHPEYDARVSLLYRPDRQRQMLSASGSTFALRSMSRPTAIGLLRRTRNMEQLAGQLGLDLEPATLKWMIQTKAERNSEIVQLFVTDAPTGDLAVRLANEAARIAIEDNAGFYRAQALQAFEAFSEQAQRARREVDELSERIVAFQAEHRLIQPDADAKAFLDTVSAAAARASAARIAHESQRVRIESLKRTIAEMPDEVVRESYEDDPVKRQIMNAEVALMQARSRYGPDNPRVRALEDEIREMRRMVGDRTQNANREQVFEANPVKRQFQTDLMRMEVEAVVLERQVRQIEEEKAEIERRFAHLPRRQIELADLQRRRQSASDLHQALQKTADNASLAAGLDLGDFELLEPARGAAARRSALVVLAPVLLALFGLAVGGTAAVILELMDPKWRTATQLERSFTVPVIGDVPWAETPDGESAAAFLPVCRGLREHWLRRVGDGDGALCFASAGRGEGKSRIARHAARYWQSLGLPAAYVDFDPAPGAGPAGAADGPGLARILRGEAEAGDVAADRHGVVCFRLEEAMPDLVERLNAPPAARFWSGLQERFRFIAVEAPAVNEDPAAAAVAALARSVVFVVGTPQTDRARVGAALDRLERCGIRPSGLVLNRVAPPGRPALLRWRRRGRPA